jgi:GntR family transcriptional regulator, transcriptional repressor for pyruvate dehydrogenase complex
MIGFNSRVDRITKDLQEQIVQGKLQPGDRLASERSLCSRFGVGRTTIREALRSLTVRGLVIRSARGAIVADLESIGLPDANLAGLAAQTSIKQLFEMRKLMEVRVAGWAALRATAEDTDAMERAIEADISRHTAAGNPSRIFHDALARAAHNPALVQVYESARHLFFRLPFYWKLFDDEEVKMARAARHELARCWHEQILKAVVERDAAEAEGAMFQHLDMMEKDLLNRLQANGSDDSGNQKRYSHPMLTDLDGDKKKTLEGIPSIR